MKTGSFVRNLLLVSFLLAPLVGPAAQTDIIDLVPGSPQIGTATARTEQGPSLHTTQYRVTVPEGAASMAITLGYDPEGGNPPVAGRPNVDLDLLARKTQEVTLADFDYIADESSAPEVLTVSVGSTPPLSSGTYFVGISSFSIVPTDYVISVEITEGPTTSPTPIITPSPTPTFVPTESPTPQPTERPTSLLGITFPPAVEEGVPIDPVRSVQARALGDVDQMIPLAFAMQTPPETYSAQAGHDTYVPGTDAHFYSLTWQMSDRVPGIPPGLMLGNPDGEDTGSLPAPPPYDLPIGSLFGTYPNFIGDATDPIDPRTGIFGALIYSDRFGDNYGGNAVSRAVNRHLLNPGIEILPGLAGDRVDALSTAAYEFGAFSAPLAVEDVRYSAVRDFVVDNIPPAFVNAYLDEHAVLPDGHVADFFFVRGNDGGEEEGSQQGPVSVVVRWDGEPGRLWQIGMRDDIDIDFTDVLGQSTIPSVFSSPSYPSRDTQLNQQRILTLAPPPTTVPSGRYYHDIVPVDVAQAGRIDSGGNLNLDTLGNVGEDVEINLDVDNIPPVFLSVELFNVTLERNDCIAGDGEGPSENDQTVRLTAVIEEPDIDAGVPGAGIDTSRITADLTEFGFGAAEPPDTVTVNATNLYGQPSRVTAVWTKASVDVEDDPDVFAYVTAYDLVGNHSTGSDSIIGDNTLPVVENAVIVNTRDEIGQVVIAGDGTVTMPDPRGRNRTDAVRNGDHVTVIANVSDVICGIDLEGISANLTEISGNAADTAVLPATFENGVVVWQLVCGNATGTGTEIKGVVPPLVDGVNWINVDITAVDHVLNTRVVPNADQGLSPLDNHKFPPPSGVGIELDNTAPTVTDVLITADNPPHDFIANGQTYTVTATITDRSLVDVERTWLGVADLNDPAVTPKQILASRGTQSATNPRPYEQVTLVWTTDATTFVKITRSDPVTQDVFVDVIPTDTLGNTKTYEDCAKIRLDNQAPTLTSAEIANLTDERTDCVNNGKTVRVTAALTDGPLGSGVTRELISADLSQLRAPEGLEQWKVVLPDTFDVVSGVATWTFVLSSNVTIPTTVNFNLTAIDRVGNRLDVPNADPNGILLDNQPPAVSNVVITNQTLGTQSWIRATQTAVVTADVTDASGCGIEASGITADLTQLTGSAGDTAVAPNSFTGGVATWNVTVGNNAPSPVNVNVAISAVDELGNAMAAPVGDPNGILLDNQKPVVEDVLIENLTRDSENLVTKNDVVRVTATVNDGTGSGIDSSAILADLSQLLASSKGQVYLGGTEGETRFTPTSYSNGVATWDLTVSSGATANVTVTVYATDRVGNENTGSDSILLDNTGPTITNVEIFNQTRSINTEIRRTETARITATIADADAGLDTNSIRANLFQLSGLPADATVVPTAFNAATGVATWSVTVLNAQAGSSTINVNVWARDLLGNLTFLANADPDGITLNNSKASLLDANGDGVSNYLDVLTMAANWGMATPANGDTQAAASAAGDPMADLNLDGVIDQTDLLIFMDDYAQ